MLKIQYNHELKGLFGRNYVEEKSCAYSAELAKTEIRKVLHDMIKSENLGALHISDWNKNDLLVCYNSDRDRQDGIVTVRLYNSACSWSEKKISLETCKKMITRIIKEHFKPDNSESDRELWEAVGTVAGLYVE